MDRLHNSRKRLEAEVRSVRNDLDNMLGALHEESAGRVANARMRYDDAVRRARIRMAKTRAVARAGAMRAAGNVDVFAHQHPWRTAGMVLAAGVLAGALIGILTQQSRRY